MTKKKQYTYDELESPDRSGSIYSKVMMKQICMAYVYGFFFIVIVPQRLRPSLKWTIGKQGEGERAGTGENTKERKLRKIEKLEKKTCTRINQWSNTRFIGTEWIDGGRDGYTEYNDMRAWMFTFKKESFR